MLLQGLLQYNLSDTLDFYHYERCSLGSKNKKTFVHADFFRMKRASASRSSRSSGYTVPMSTSSRSSYSFKRRRAVPSLPGSGGRRVRAASVLGVETKFFDTAMTARALTAPTDSSGGECIPTLPAGGVTAISTPATGDTEQSRDGKRILLKNVQCKINVTSAVNETSTTPPTANRVFVALVLDTQSNGAVLNSEDVYKNLSAVAVQATSPLRNLLFANRFKVLRSEEFDLTPDTLSHFVVDSFAFSSKSHEVEWFVPLNEVVNFNAGTTADIANVIDKSLHIIAYCNNSTTVTSTIAYNARIRFQG